MTSASTRHYSSARDIPRAFRIFPSSRFISIGLVHCCRLTPNIAFLEYNLNVPSSTTNCRVYANFTFPGKQLMTAHLVNLLKHSWPCSLGFSVSFSRDQSRIRTRNNYFLRLFFTGTSTWSRAASLLTSTTRPPSAPLKTPRSTSLPKGSKLPSGDQSN
jgi:hypothetical protein